MLEEGVRDRDVVSRSPDRFGHRGPLVAPPPFDMATQRRRFLHDGEHRHDRVEGELSVPGGCQVGHPLGVPMCNGKAGVRKMHEPRGHDRGRVHNRRGVDGLPSQGREDPRSARHERAAFLAPFCIAHDVRHPVTSTHVGDGLRPLGEHA